MKTGAWTGASRPLLSANGDAIVGDILRDGVMGGTLQASHPNYPIFLYDLADKRVIHDSVQCVLDRGARRLYTGHGLARQRLAVAHWLKKQRHADAANRH